MAYGDFDLKSAVAAFGLVEDRDTDLFADVEPLEPGESLRRWLEEFAPVALGLNTEKGRSEFIIAPILVEAKRRSPPPVTILSGVNFDVDRPRGLTGFCDYLIAGSAEYYYVEGPIVAVVEAKREDLIAGFGQCVAEMVAIGIFNEREGTPLAVVFGCVTSGNIWRFLKLEGDRLSIDRPEYHLRDAAKLLGILVTIFGGRPGPEDGRDGR